MDLRSPKHLLNNAVVEDQYTFVCFHSKPPMSCQQCLLPLCLFFVVVVQIVSLSSSTPCTDCPGRSEIFRLLELIFALQGLKCGVLLPSRRAMLQRNALWRIPKPVGGCDALMRETYPSMEHLRTGYSVCMALVGVPDCGPLQEQNLLWKSLQLLSFSSHKGIPWWVFVSSISTWISELEYVGKENP